jgi:hypothetical protein
MLNRIYKLAGKLSHLPGILKGSNPLIAPLRANPCHAFNRTLQQLIYINSDPSESGSK